MTVRFPSHRSPAISLPYTSCSDSRLSRSSQILEHDAGEMSEFDERQQIGRLRERHSGRTATDHTDPKWRNHGVPTRLLVRHPNVVAVVEVEGSVGDPAELDRLTLDGFASHPFDLLEDQECLVHPDPVRVVEQQLHRQHVGGVADIDGHGGAMRTQHRDSATPIVGCILDVVVDQKRVVIQLERRQTFEPGRCIRPPRERPPAESQAEGLCLPETDSQQRGRTAARSRWLDCGRSDRVISSATPSFASVRIRSTSPRS